MIGVFPMDAVAGARQTPGRLKTGGVPPKPPAAILLSLWTSVFWDFGSLFRTFRGHFLRAVAAAVSSSTIAAATSALCRGTSQQNIAFQMFLQLQTLWRLVSRHVAAGVSPSPQTLRRHSMSAVAAQTMGLSRFAERWSHICKYPERRGAYLRLQSPPICESQRKTSNQRRLLVSSFWRARSRGSLTS